MFMRYTLCHLGLPTCDVHEQRISDGIGRLPQESIDNADREQHIT